MVTDSILLISKFSARARLGLALALIVCTSCSSPQKNAVALPSDSELAESLATLSQEVQRFDTSYGPTMTEGTSRFVDRTDDYGLAGIEATSFVVVDLNRDLWDDLIVMPGYFSQPRFFLFDPALKRFVESTHAFFPEVLQASYLLVADFNNDGVKDVVVGVLNQRGEFSKLPISLWHGSWDEKNLLRFTRAERFVNLPPEPTSSLVAVDVNLDGRLDLFVGNWYQEKKKTLLPTADRLLLNLPEKWVDASERLSGEQSTSGGDLFPPNAKPTYGASSCDVDQDGWPDILTASSSGHYNKLWMNRPTPAGDARTFVDVGRDANYAADTNGVLVPTGGGRSFSVVCADYNDDGLMDIFMGELSHGWDNLGVDRSSVLTGSKPTYPPFFLRTEYMSDAAADNWNQGDKRAQWADLNLDGHVDLVVDNSGFPPLSRLVAFAQDETHAFVNVAHQWGLDVVNPTGTVIADFNHDGKLDVLTAQSSVRKASITNRVYLLENQLDLTGRRSFVFHLEAQRANRDALGAMVLLYVEEEGKRTVQRRWHEWSQGGIPSQNPAGVHFGVNAGAKVVGVKVRWPIPKSAPQRRGKTLERLYPLTDNPKTPHQVFTLCESGEKQRDRFRCR